RLMDLFYEKGGRFLDTAHVYAAWLKDGAGKSERCVGEWMRANGMENEVVVATKGGHRSLEDDVSSGNLSRKFLEQQLSESLDRLGLDYVALYWLHRDEPERPVEKIMETLATFHDEGRIGAIGASNWTTARMEAANRFARDNGLPEFVASQPRFSAAHSTKTDTPNKNGMITLGAKGLAWHRKTQVALIPYSSQANGFFGSANVKWAKGGFEGEAPTKPQNDSPENRKRLLSAIDIAARVGATANQVALAALIGLPFPVYPIIGTSKADHLTEALDATQIKLGKADVQSIIPEGFSDE
ncbi:MAG: aldo/keto reductase, partial [Candidatus Sumerlaeota bacterium]